jgi:hypothetical protein
MCSRYRFTFIFFCRLIGVDVMIGDDKKLKLDLCDTPVKPSPMGFTQFIYSSYRPSKAPSRPAKPRINARLLPHYRPCVRGVVRLRPMATCSPSAPLMQLYSPGCSANTSVAITSHIPIVTTNQNVPCMPLHLYYNCYMAAALVSHSSTSPA